MKGLKASKFEWVEGELLQPVAGEKMLKKNAELRKKKEEEEAWAGLRCGPRGRKKRRKKGRKRDMG